MSKMRGKPDLTGIATPKKDPNAFLEGGVGDAADKAHSKPAMPTADAPPVPIVQKLFRLRWDVARALKDGALEESVPGEHYGRWAAWGDPQHEQLVQHLRDVHAERQRGELALNQSGVETSKQFSWTASARALLASVALA